jgi:hypothetical protein
MELFTQLFGRLLLFVYHCFDRIVINAYLSGLSRPEQVVHFFRQILGGPILSKEVLSQRTNDYQNWVEAFARNTTSPSSGPKKVSAKRIRSCPGCVGCARRAPMESISFSRAWNKERPSASACRSILQETPTTASWRINAAASRTTTSTFTIKCLDRS